MTLDSLDTKTYNTHIPYSLQSFWCIYQAAVAWILFFLSFFFSWYGTRSMQSGASCCECVLMRLNGAWLAGIFSLKPSSLWLVREPNQRLRAETRGASSNQRRSHEAGTKVHVWTIPVAATGRVCSSFLGVLGAPQRDCIQSPICSQMNYAKLSAFGSEEFDSGAEWSARAAGRGGGGGGKGIQVAFEWITSRVTRNDAADRSELWFKCKIIPRGAVRSWPAFSAPRRSSGTLLRPDPPASPPLREKLWFRWNGQQRAF